MSLTVGARRLLAEALGTLILVMAVVGSGIMALKLAGGNLAVALLCNTIPTVAILFVLITMLGPVSGAHFNPIVTLVMRLKGELSMTEAVSYVFAQIAGGCLGTLLAHAMFDLAILQTSTTVRTVMAQWIAEAIAAFGLLLTILLTVRVKPDAVATAVGLYITSAYWFTASTSFANPAVTIARADRYLRGHCTSRRAGLRHGSDCRCHCRLRGCVSAVSGRGTPIVQVSIA